MNPIFSRIIFDAAREVTKTCPHCKKMAVYYARQVGQFYKCKHCSHRFKEKG